MTQIFKKGDKVFDIQFGWGEVDEINGESIFPVYVNFDSGIETYTQNGYYDDYFKHPSLSFTEYTLQGFSQERPIDYNDYIGCWGKFWGDCEDEEKIIGKLYSYTNKIGVLPFYHDKAGAFKNFQPLTDEQLKALGLTNKSK